MPADSAKVGTAIADIFGGPGEDAGLQYLITLKDIETNLENVKNKAGELGALQEQQLNSQTALQQAIANLFDATGGTFESLTASVKIFVYDTLASLINGISKVIKFVADNKTAFLTFGGIVAGVTAIVNAHNIAMMLTVVRTKAVAVAQATLNSVISLGRAVLALLTAGYLACTGNVVAATAAMKVFNLAIKSNPIGLILSGITLLVTALIGLGEATEEATEAEKERQKQLEKTKEQEEAFKRTVAESAKAQIASFLKLKKEWELLGESFDKKKKFITDTKDEWSKLGISIKTVNEMEKLFEKHTEDMIDSILIRAQVKAYEDRIQQVADDMVQTIEDNKTYTYLVASTNIRFTDLTEEEKAAVSDQDSEGNFIVAGRGEQNLRSVSGWESYWALNEEGARIINQMRKDAALAQALQNQENARANAENRINGYLNEIRNLNAQLKSKMKQIPGDELDEDDLDPDTMTTTPTSTIKTEEDIQKRLLQLYQKTVQEKLALETEGTEEWLELKEEAIAIDSALQMLAVEESKKQALKDLENSTLTEEEKAQRAIEIEQMAKEQILAISEQADLAEEEAAKRVAQYKEELAVKEIERIQDEYASRFIESDATYQQEVKAIYQRYKQEVEAAKDNVEEIARIEEKKGRFMN